MSYERLLEPILYGDMFDYPLTAEEIWQFAPIKCTLEEVKTVFATDSTSGGLKEKVVEKDGYYCFKGRDHIINIRMLRLQHSRLLWKKTQFIARLIQYAPFVRAITVTGSLAMNNVRIDSDDIDFFVFTEEKRLWMVFTVLGTLGRLSRGRIICPNYYLSIGHFLLKRRDLFTAREIAQAKPLVGFSYYEDFLRLNKWITNHFPNFNHNLNQTEKIHQRPLPRILKLSIEKLLGGTVGDKLEKFLKTILKSRLHVHHKTFNSELDRETLTNALDEVELRFHARRHREDILSEFQKRVKKALCEQSI